MQIVTRKSEVKIYLEEVLAVYPTKGISACVWELHSQILTKKVKFPLLEYCGDCLFETLSQADHIDFCDQVERLKTEGGNVILGKILQHRLALHFTQSLEKATEYISKANIWYVCDIIGERVFGYALLTNPEKTLPEIKKLSSHPSNWVVRSLGAGAHNAIRKGLEKEQVIAVFQILLTMANTKDKEIRQGVGWAAKTTAKFHPEIIDLFQTEIEADSVASWFRTKIKIGLSRNAYSQGL